MRVLVQVGAISSRQFVGLFGGQRPTGDAVPYKDTAGGTATASNHIIIAGVYVGRPLSIGLPGDSNGPGAGIFPTLFGILNM